jgi:hypothetical protein
MPACSGSPNRNLLLNMMLGWPREQDEVKLNRRPRNQGKVSFNKRINVTPESLTDVKDAPWLFSKMENRKPWHQQPGGHSPRVENSWACGGGRSPIGLA